MPEPIRSNEPQSLEQRDLNGQLWGLYDQLPSPWRPVNNANYAAEFLARISKLNNSEHRDIIFKKVCDILHKSSTTPTFQSMMAGFLMTYM